MLEILSLCIYNGILWIFIRSWKYLSARISGMRWSRKLIFHQSIVLMGTTDPENMSFLRHLWVVERKISIIVDHFLWNPIVIYKGISHFSEARYPSTSGTGSRRRVAGCSKYYLFPIAPSRKYSQLNFQGANTNMKLPTRGIPSFDFGCEMAPIAAILYWP